MRPLDQLKRMLPKIVDSNEDGLDTIYSTGGTSFMIRASWGLGWEHVSVSIPRTTSPIKRTPTWGEMCMIKDLFWFPEETVIQFHPAKTEYINMHKYCLHLWRPTKEKLPIPPKMMTGF